MISRRVLLGTGGLVVAGAAAVVAAQATHRLDDVADAVGLDPKPQSDPADRRLLRAAGESVGTLLALAEATSAAHPGLRLGPFVSIVREQGDAVSAPRITIDAEPPPDDPRKAVARLQDGCRDTAERLRDVAVGAVSPDLARVLASMSAGLTQSVRALERPR